MTENIKAEEHSTMTEQGYVPVGQGRDATPVNLYYEIHGSGIEKVLLVMGLSTPCQAWEHQCKYLAETGKYTVIIFDNRGMGKSDSPSGLYSTSQMASDAFDLLDHFGWTSGIHLVGISMGGMISLEMATTEPERLKTLTLTSTCAKKNIPTIRAVTTLAKSAFVSKTLDERVDNMVSLVYPPSWLDQACQEEDYATNREMVKARAVQRGTKTRVQPLHGNIGQTAACLRHYVSDARLLTLRKVGLPVMIVTGTWDYLVRPEYSYHMEKVLKARLEVFEGSGHGLPEEQKEKYNALLLDHFSQTSS
ncbi:Alpha/Beta hydrolase protein [Absidia repens]|uniref:Alpha/Beta hydrolase protein n=1 Tax=Absidia repens TaxID=90262 RepID=A0A1X2I7Y2_9FUNG|nr:Alpha/Beta hydrolase protein [Absidia repens]